MPVTKQTYTVGNMKQLIDLNGDKTNFELKFKVSCSTGNEFDLLVVDQTTLDAGGDLQYKRAKGQISGSLRSDKNLYQNWFLILKADETCDVEIEIDITELPKNIQSVEQPGMGQGSNIPPNTMSLNNPMQQPQSQLQPQTHPPPQPEGFNWKLLLLVIAVVGGAILLWYFYTQSGDSKPIENALMGPEQDNGAEKVVDQVVPPVVKQPSPVPAPDRPPTAPSPARRPVPAPSTRYQPSPARRPTGYQGERKFNYGDRRGNNDLISRLKRLPMK